MRATSRGISVIAIAAVFGLAFIAPSSRAQITTEQPPNVLVVVTDDQRADGTMNMMPKTKQWLGRDGVRFTHAYATTPTCCPSRASIFTGRYAHNHQVHTTEEGQALNLDQATTVQSHLRDNGYRTALFGKYLNGWDIEEAPPHFDRWGLLSGFAGRFFYDGVWNVDGEVGEVSTYSTSFIRRLSLEFITEGEETDEQPWLMYVTVLAPHLPADPHPKDLHAEVPPFEESPAVIEEDKTDKPTFVQDKTVNMDWIKARRRDQLRSLLAVDRMMEALRDQLEETDELENTLVLYTSDNGFMWGEHGLGGKAVAYEPSVNVPLYMSWPAGTTGGTVDERLVGNVDIAPTIYEATGIEPTYVVDGRSLFDSFSRDRMLLEHWKKEKKHVNWAAHRTLAYKFIETYATEHLVPEWREYYELVNDPWEVTNLLTPPFLDGPDGAQLRRDLLCEGTTGLTACP